MEHRIIPIGYKAVTDKDELRPGMLVQSGLNHQTGIVRKELFRLRVNHQGCIDGKVPVYYFLGSLRVDTEWEARSLLIPLQER